MSSTSIGFGGGEVILVDLPLSEVRLLVQEGLTSRALLEFQEAGGDMVVINPEQVKVLQSGAPVVPAKVWDSADIWTVLPPRERSRRVGWRRR